MEDLMFMLLLAKRKMAMTKKFIRERNRQKFEERGINMDYFRMREALEEEEEKMAEMLKRKRERMLKSGRKKKKMRWV